jgi:osmotically-inducible protein OsmY
MKTDTDIKADVMTELVWDIASALRWSSLIPDEYEQVEVESGWVTLTGEVDWGYQFARDEQCIRQRVGVRGLSNQIVIKPRINSKDIGAEITAELTRHATREAKHIGIEVNGGILTLQGKVHSLAEHDAAVGVAFTARGVSQEIDKLEVVA